MSFNQKIYGSADEPVQTYYFSDVYGGNTADLLSVKNPDEIISTDLRADPTRKTHEKFDIYHNPPITDHVLRTAVHLRDVLGKKQGTDLHKTHQTGIFINSAPRTNNENGKPFYVAETDNGLRIVCTPLEAISAIRDRIRTLGHLPNEDNGLYDNDEQFRSSFTPVLLNPEHGYELVEDELDAIPIYKNNEWHVAYVDRFGNIVTYVQNPDEQWQKIVDASKEKDEGVYITINGRTRKCYVGASLGTNPAGEMSVYKNGCIDIARKWQKSETPAQRIKKSAYKQFQPTLLGKMSGRKNTTIGEKISV